MVGRDVDDINSADGASGLPRVHDNNGGPHLTDLGDPGESDTAIKGISLELRVADRKIGDGLDSGSYWLSYEPDVDLRKLTDDDLDKIARKVYGTEEFRGELKDALFSDSGKQKEIELDGFQSKDDAGVYYEAKNTQEVPRTISIQRKAARYFATQLRRGVDADEVEMIVYTRSPRVADKLNGRINEDWFTAKPIVDADTKAKLKPISMCVSICTTR